MCATVWSDNGSVKILLNYHKSIIVANGLMWKKMPDNVEGQSETDTTMQTVD